MRWPIFRIVVSPMTVSATTFRPSLDQRRTPATGLAR
jgi:hypothetical protein